MRRQCDRPIRGGGKPKDDRPDRYGQTLESGRSQHLETIPDRPKTTRREDANMTIESVSHPEPLSDWDGKDAAQPFYLEVFGETTPTIDTAYAEVIPAGAADGSAERCASAPVYEYWWTIGHPGHPGHRGGLLEKIAGPKDLWERLADPAARIYLYFPLGGGWRVKELTATVKYMSPVAHEESFIEKAAQDFQTIQPF